MLNKNTKFVQPVFHKNTILSRFVMQAVNSLIVTDAPSEQLVLVVVFTQ